MEVASFKFLISCIPFLVLAILVAITLGSSNSIVTHYSFPESASHTKKADRYCSFFNNRAPTPQPELKNCTWFRGNSCCLQREIDATFIKVKPLQGASPACLRYLNYLMCYICAPDQNRFYEKERLRVCEPFCDAFYDACKSAILKGSVIRDLYDNGRAFCESRRFEVGNDQNCFNHQMEDVYNNNSSKHKIHFPLLVLLLSVSFFLMEKNAASCESRNPPVKDKRKFTKRNTLYNSYPMQYLSMLTFCIMLLYQIDVATGATKIKINQWSQEIFKDLSEFSKSAMFNDDLQKEYSDVNYVKDVMNGKAIVKSLQKKLEAFFTKQLAAVDNLAKSITESHTNIRSRRVSVDLLPHRDFIDADDSLNFPRSWLKKNRDFKTDLLMNASTVKIPDDIYRGNPQVVNAINFSSSLDGVFLSNAASSKEIRWQYFGSVTGVHRQFPGREWQNNFVGFKEDFDPRRRPWYISATSGPKDIVIILDGSKSMSEYGRLSLMKMTAVALVDTLTKSDSVTVIVSRSTYYTSIGQKIDHKADTLSCQGNKLVGATSSNRKDLKSKIYKIKAEGGSDHLSSFKTAYKLLHGQNTGCQQLILFVGDGDVKDGMQRCDPGFHRYDGNSRRYYVSGEICNYKYKELLKLVHDNHHVKMDQVKIFTFSVGNGVQLQDFPRQLACSGGGLLIPITSEYNVIKQMDPYFLYLVHSSVIQNKIMWTSPYLDSGGLGLIITAARAVYSKDNELLGVVGVDAVLNTFETILLNNIWGNVHTFMIDDQASVIVHPLIRTSAQLVDDPVRVNILSLETHEGKPDQFSEVVKHMINGSSGNFKISKDAQQAVSNGFSLAWRSVSYLHYFYAGLKESGYSVAIVLTSDDEIYTRPTEPTTFTRSFLDDLNGYLKLSNPDTLVNEVSNLQISYSQAGFPGTKTTKKASVVKLSYQTFCIPENNTGDYLLHWLDSYINKIAPSQLKCPDSVLHPEVLADIKVTSVLNSLWLQRPKTLQDGTLWSYVGTASGVLRIFPGVKLKDDYNPTRRWWYRGALVVPGRLAVTPVYNDEAGAEKVVTLSKTVHKAQPKSPTPLLECSDKTPMPATCSCVSHDRCQSGFCDNNGKCSGTVQAVTAFDIRYPDLYKRIVDLSKKLDGSRGCDEVYSCEGSIKCETKCYLIDHATNLVLDRDFNKIPNERRLEYEGVSLSVKQGRLFQLLKLKGFIEQKEMVDYQAVCSSSSIGYQLKEMTLADTAESVVQYSGPIPENRMFFGCIQKVIYYSVNKTWLDDFGGAVSGVLDGDPCGSGDYHVTAIPNTNLYLVILENYKQKKTYFDFNCKTMNSIQKPGSFDVDKDECGEIKGNFSVLPQETCPAKEPVILPCDFISSSPSCRSWTAVLIPVLLAVFIMNWK